MKNYKWMVLFHKTGEKGYLCALDSFAKKLMADAKIADYKVVASEKEAIAYIQATI